MSNDNGKKFYIIRCKYCGKKFITLYKKAAKTNCAIHELMCARDRKK